jgi:hypothetical protein
MTHPNTSLDNPNSISTIEELESNALKASEAYKNSVKELVVKRLGLIF